MDVLCSPVRSLSHLSVPETRSPGRMVPCRRSALISSARPLAEYNSLLNENGFEVVAHVVEDPSCGLHTIWLSQLR
jgi:hypothetical protein